MRRLTVLAIIVLVYAADAGTHAPATAIGRAVEAFGSVPVSYDPGAAVSEIEAAGFVQIVGTNPKVAFMPASALSELAGGPNAIAEEVAREAQLDGTLVVLVRTRLGAWSDEIGDERLAELVREAQASAAVPPAARAEALVRSVQAEPTGGTPWVAIGGVLAVVAIGALVAFDRLSKRRARAQPSR